MSDVRITIGLDDWKWIYEAIQTARSLAPSRLFAERADWAHEAFIAGTPLDVRADLLRRAGVEIIDR